MNIFGIGVDIVECERIAQSLDRFGDRFRERVFLPSEISYCAGMKFPAPHFAARFAAKEAISKCFRTGIGRDIGFQDLEIVREVEGAPAVVLHGNAAQLAKRLGVGCVLISLSHTRDYAVAQAIAVMAASADY